MPFNNIPFISLLVSTFLVLCMTWFVVRIKHKKQIHYVFLSLLVLMNFWNLGIILAEFLWREYKIGSYITLYITYFGIIYLPVAFMMTGIVFSQTKLKFRYKNLWILFLPSLSYIILLTNNLHQLFYEKIIYVVDLNNVYGSYFMVHTIISYMYILIGLYLLVFFSIKNSGFFSTQSLLIIIGSILPIILNVLYSLKLMVVSPYATPAAFSFTIFFYVLGVLKYNFLNIAPIALQKVVDHISDCFVVLNDDLIIIDYNQTLFNEFKRIYNIRRSEKLIDILYENNKVNIDTKGLSNVIQKVKDTKIPVTLEKNICIDDYNKYFTVEIKPIYSTKNTFIGILILLKDITEYKKYVETIKESQMILLEQERLASLGQLIGGIAHNMKTPIMSLSGGIEALKDLTDEYEQSIDDDDVTVSDHHEIVTEMREWLEKMRPYCAYMSDIISAVKGQAVQMNDSTTTKFTVDELVKRVDLLMKHELKKYHCALQKDFAIDMNTEIKGEINNLVQVFDNIIMNSVQAYDGKEGVIDFNIVQCGDNIEFSFRDYARGIPQNIADRLFKEMITTKGKNGTGLGLYMSYSTIKGRFSGNMTFTSKEGFGTTFLITIPCITYSIKEAAV